MEQLMEALELEDEARRKITETKKAELLLTDDVGESTEYNELKDTLSQLRSAHRGAEFQRLTD